MKKALIFVGSCVALSCHQEPTPTITKSCQVNNPLQELTWLQDSIARYNRYGGEVVTVWQAQYEQQTVFHIDAFLGPDAGVGALCWCDGSFICKPAISIAGEVGNCGNVLHQLTNQTVIYEKKR